MTAKAEFDLSAAHRYFAAEGYNQAWGLLDKADRTPEEDEAMLRLSMASHWHWTQRADCTAENESIACWQLARIHTVLRRVEDARRYAQLCLKASQAPGLPDFCLGYAYEAAARAEMIAGDTAQMRIHIEDAHQVAARMTDAEAQKMLLDDLATIQ